MRYFYHPESESLWAQEDDEDVNSDGLVEEIDKETYLRLQASESPGDEVTQ